MRKESKPDEDGDHLVIARILTGSMIDRQGKRIRYFGLH